jgi:hypothetical protein
MSRKRARLPQPTDIVPINVSYIIGTHRISLTKAHSVTAMAAFDCHALSEVAFQEAREYVRKVCHR